VVHKCIELPVIFEVFHFVDWSCVDELTNFCGADNISIVSNPDGSKELYIKTEGGDIKVEENEYIFKGINGEGLIGKFYICEPDVFKSLVEETIFEVK